MRRNLYRDEAVVERARPESLDGLVRVDPPHQYVATRLAAGLVLLVLGWLVAGTADHSLWLRGVPAEQWDAETAAPILEGAGEGRVELLAFVSAGDAARLAPGMRVHVLSAGAAARREAAGAVLSVAGEAAETPERMAPGISLPADPSFVVRIAVPAHAAAGAGAADGVHRLRVPLGRQSPLQFLTRQLD